MPKFWTHQTGGPNTRWGVYKWNSFTGLECRAVVNNYRCKKGAELKINQLIKRERTIKTILKDKYGMK